MARLTATRRVPSVPSLAGPGLEPQDLEFFKPPKGVDALNPLKSIERQRSPLVSSLVFDKGTYRSRHAVGAQGTARLAGDGPLLTLAEYLDGSLKIGSLLFCQNTAFRWTAGGWVAGVGTPASGTDRVSHAQWAASGLEKVKPEVVGDPTTTVFSSDATSHLVNMPASVVAGRLLLIVFVSHAAFITVVLTPPGWTNKGGFSFGKPLFTTVAGVGNVFARIATGTEGGTTVDVVTSVAETGVAQVYQISPWFGSLAGVELSGGGDGFSPEPEHPALTPTWGTAPNLWFAITGLNNSVTLAGGPSSYTDDGLVSSGTGNTHVSLATARRTIELATEDPPNFTLTESRRWGTATLAVRPLEQTLSGVMLFTPGVAGAVSQYNSGDDVVGQLPGSPTAKHITLFGNRVIASFAAGFPQRIQWTVKNNKNDWTGLGSGYEDLLYPPGGMSDEVMGVFPVSDDVAFLVKASSIWTMRVTGNVDVPFDPTIRLPGVGSPHRHSIAPVPGGIIFVGHDDVYVVTMEGIRRVGTLVFSQLVSGSGVLVGRYNPYTQKYRLANGSSSVWEFSFNDDGWTRLDYPFSVKAVDAPVQAAGYANDVVAGLSTSRQWYSLMDTSSGRFATVDDPSRLQDINGAGANVDSAIEIQTPMLVTATPLDRVMLIEAQLQYEASASQTLIFDHSTDGGATWSQYSTISIVATSGEDVLRVKRTFEAPRLMVRARSTTLGKIRLISLHLFIVSGAKIKP